MKAKLLSILFLALTASAYAMPNPPAPEGILSAQTTQHEDILSFTNPNGQGTINVYRAPGTCSTSSVFVALASNVAFAGPYTDASPLVGVQCYYVTAVVNGVESAPSNKISVTSLVLPQPPTGLVGAPN